MLNELKPHSDRMDLLITRQSDQLRSAEIDIM